jgi:hypothetical protein
MSPPDEGEDPLSLLDFDDIEEDAKDVNVSQVTLEGTKYRYASNSRKSFIIDLKHRPDKVRDGAHSIVHRLAFMSMLGVIVAFMQGLSFQIWPSSLTLARFAEWQDEQHPDYWHVSRSLDQHCCLQIHPLQCLWCNARCKQGKRVLELGCGCGLVGLCFAALGATVLLTDLPDPLVQSSRLIHPQLLE